MSRLKTPSAIDQNPPQEALPDFTAPWCQRLLADPAYQHIAPNTRRAGSSDGASHNTLMGKTLFTDSTLRAIQYLYKPKDQNNEQIIGGDLIALISVGNDMCSHVNVLHGGVNTILVDEVGGALAVKEAPPGASMMAVNFNVNLRKSVRTPSVIIGRAWLEKKPERRKVWVKCTIEQDGVTCIDAECLYVVLKPVHAKI